MTTKVSKISSEEFKKTLIELGKITKDNVVTKPQNHQKTLNEKVIEKRNLTDNKKIRLIG